MNHETALKYALSGNNAMAAEVEAHLAECGACRRELAGLRALEGELVAAAPHPMVKAGLEKRVLYRLGWASESRRWFQGGSSALWKIAACALLAVGLVAAWSVFPSRGLPSSGVEMAAREGGVASQITGETAAYLLQGGLNEGSTTALLSRAEKLAVGYRETESAELKVLLDPTNRGDWNG